MKEFNISANNAITVRPMTGRIGAEISGVRLSADLDPATVSAIREAILRHKVVFFRGQDHLRKDEQVRFAALFGTACGHPVVPTRGGAASITETARANIWHTDLTYCTDYTAINILRAQVIPDFGGDTAWANTATAYDALPEPLRRLAESLWAVHTNKFDYVSVDNVDPDLAHAGTAITMPMAAEHPVVRVHPETGERTLVLGGFASHIADVSSKDSKALLELFRSYIHDPKNTVRWRWSVGDIAIWDNRATQHIGIDDYAINVKRRLTRTQVVGEIPVSVDGKASRVLTGGNQPWYKKDKPIAFKLATARQRAKQGRILITELGLRRALAEYRKQSRIAATNHREMIKTCG